MTMAWRCSSLPRRCRGLAGGLALLAVLMLALVPAMSRLQAVADPLAWVQVCTPGGLVLAQTQPSGEPMPNPADHIRLGDGASASLQAHAHVLPAAAVAWALPAVPGAALPVAGQAAAAQAPLWRHAQARAPPRA